MLDKIKCVLRYDGTNFYGFQIQPHQRTVQGEIEQAVQTIHKGESIRIYGSGRTDKGVHAMEQTIHFSPKVVIPEQNWQRALNTLLPDDIYVTKVENVSSSFHARFDAKEKEYRYYVWNNEEPDIFKRNYVYQYPHKLDIEKIQKSCHYLQGEHDFTTFSSAKATIKGSKVRRLTNVSCQHNGNQLEFIFKGNGFLYHMVRIMVGALLDIGRGIREPEDIPGLLDQRDRGLLGATAPPQGLYLWEVIY